MTKIKSSLAWVAFCVVIIICIARGTLVQAENTQVLQRQDRFVGFHIVVGPRDQDRSKWVEYGESTLDTGEFGSFSFPNSVLFGEYQEDTGEWIFPGMPGNNAFYTTCGAEEEGLSSGYAGLHTDVNIAFSSHLAQPYAHTLEDVDADTSVLVDDTRDSISLSGTVYLPASQMGHIVTYYRVYETMDGRIYLDGSGNSSSGDGIEGFGMGSTEEEVVTVNGTQSYTATTDIWVDVEYVYPCVSLLLLEYNAANECIATTALSTEEQELSLHPDATWCVVQETDAIGETRQTALSVADKNEFNQLYHGFVVETADDVIKSNCLKINVL